MYETLRPGGKLIIKEGIKPEKGSEEEKKLIEEMEKYGTLEKPFLHDELKKILSDAGFKDIEAYEFVNTTVKRKNNKLYPDLKDISVPQTNTILCRKPGEYFNDSQNPGNLLAKIENIVKSYPQKVSVGETIELKLKINNVGDTLWLSNSIHNRGFVTIGTKLLDGDKNYLSDHLDRTFLQSNVYPGDSIVVTHRFRIPSVCGIHWIKIDLVDEQITWFEEKGSEPLVFCIDIKGM